MQDGGTFQPLIVAVGSPNHITKFHVVVNEQLFDVDSVLEAIELTENFFRFGLSVSIKHKNCLGILTKSTFGY